MQVSDRGRDRYHGFVKRILVTGATGTVGRQVVAQLLDIGAHVRALTRDPHRAALPREVEAIRGDLTVPETMDASLRDVDAVFLLWTAAAEAFPAARARIARHTGRLVMLTSPHQTPHPFFQQPNPMASMYKNMERLIRESGLVSTFVRPGMFAANALGWWAAGIREHDVIRWPYGDAATAPIDERDIAAVAVRALFDDAAGGAEYMITGPDSLTQREQVIAIGDVYRQNTPIRRDHARRCASRARISRRRDGHAPRCLGRRGRIARLCHHDRRRGHRYPGANVHGVGEKQQTGICSRLRCGAFISRRSNPDRPAKLKQCSRCGRPR
jgi:uncharacterized protein YbjT (DUF2867 family)